MYRELLRTCYNAAFAGAAASHCLFPGFFRGHMASMLADASSRLKSRAKLNLRAQLNKLENDYG
jgi:hypothetical protein